MLNTGKKNSRFARQKKILTLVLSENKFWTKQKTITPLFKLNGRSLIHMDLYIDRPENITFVATERRCNDQKKKVQHFTQTNSNSDKYKNVVWYTSSQKWRTTRTYTCTVQYQGQCVFVVSWLNS